MRLSTNLILLFTAAVFAGHAQWLDHRDPNIPRTKDGKADLAAPAPKLFGKPDLSGVWEAERTPSSEFARVLGPGFEKVQVDAQDVTKEMISVFWGVKPQEEPLRPETVQMMKQHAFVSPGLQCLPSSIPVSTFVFNFKLVQAPNEIIMLTGTGDPPRQIYTDGRTLPKDPDPTWMGYSAGRWEGDTLVVETAGFNDKSYLDASGHPRSQSMRITERFHRRDLGHMDLEMTFDDSKYYTRPFTIKTVLHLMPDTDVLEYVCNEGEKDRAHVAN